MAAPANTQVLSAIADIMKERLLPKIVEQLNSKVPLLTLLDRELVTEHTVGRNGQIIVPVRTQHNQSVGMRAELGALPDHQKPTFDQMTVGLKYMYGRCAFSGPSLAQGLNAAKLANTLNDQMKSLERSFELDLNRQIQGEGSGSMGRITTASGSGTSFVMDSARYIEPGMVIDAYTAKTGGDHDVDSATVTDVDHATDTVTVSASVTWVQNDYVFREDNRGLEAMGLEGIVDDGTVVSTFQGIDRTATSLFNGNLIDGSTAALDEDLVQQAVDQVADISGETVDFLGSDRKSRRWWQKVLVAERRQANTVQLKGGIGGLGFMSGNKEVPWFVDRYFPDGYIYMLHFDDLFFVDLGDPDWMDMDGAILKYIPGYDAYEAILYYYWAFAARRCNALGRLYNFTEPT